MRAAPAPYVSSVHGTTRVVALPEARQWASDALAHGSLHAFAAQEPGAEVLRGRGASYSVRGPADDRYVVRHYWRGGAVARALGDLYLRVGAPRPHVELVASDTARARGIATPAIVAYAVYPAGAFYRADIATVEVPLAKDLAQLLFATHVDKTRPVEICTIAGTLIRNISRQGIIHRDLNIKNVLLQADSLQPWLLDLDGCTITHRASAAQSRTMLARFVRSLQKWERTSGRPLPTEAHRALIATATSTA